MSVERPGVDVIAFGLRSIVMKFVSASDVQTEVNQNCQKVRLHQNGAGSVCLCFN
jgi:hypothetical protein